MPEETWKFAVIAFSPTGLTEFFGSPVKTYEDALRLQKSALTSGWHTAKVYRASFEEVKKPRAK